MALNAGSVVAQFKSDISGMQKGIASVKSQVSGLKTSFSKVGTEMANAGVTLMRYGAIGAVALGAVGYSAIKTAGDLEQQRMAFKTLLGSVEEADKALEMIKKDAQTTPFELTGLIEANKLLTAVTKDAPRSEAMLLNVGKSLSAVGKGQAELDRIIVNLQQIGAVGKASMIDIKQFAFAGIPIFEMLTETTGKSGDALSDLISDGGVTFDLLEGMFKKYGEDGGRFAGAFEDQAGTFNQVWSNLKDSMVIFGSEFVKQTGLFDLAKKALSGLVNWIDQNKEAMVAWAKEVGAKIAEFAKKVGTAMAPVVEWIKKFFSEAENRKAVIIGLFAGIVILIAAAVIAFISAHLVIIAIVAAVMLVAGALSKYWTEMVGGWQYLMEIITNAFQTYWQGLVDFWMGVVNAIWTGVQAIGGFFAALYEIFIKPPVDAIIMLFQFFATIFGWLWNNVVFPLLELAFAIFARIFYEIYLVVQQAWDWIYSKAIKPTLDAIWSVIQTVLGAISTFFSVTWEIIKIATSAAWKLVEKYIIDPISSALDKIHNIFQSLIDWLKGIWNGIKDFFVSMKDAMVNAIVAPFEDAKEKIEQIAQKIKDLADKINPFHKESPSLVENVEKGVGKIIGSYQSMVGALNGMDLRGSVMQFAGEMTGGGSGANITINNNNNVNDALDAQTISERMAFQLRAEF